MNKNQDSSNVKLRTTFSSLYTTKKLRLFSFEFEVELAEISGSETLLHLTRGNAKIITSIEEVMDFKIRDKVKINFKSNKAYAFDETGNLASSPFGGSSV